MKDNHTDYPYVEKGARKAPDNRELSMFVQAAVREGGSKKMPVAARSFARGFSAAVTHYPAQKELPNWLRGLIEKKASVDELAQTLHDRLRRAPSKENQELALIVANEVARMDGGSEALSKHITPELLVRLSGQGGKEK